MPDLSQLGSLLFLPDGRIRIELEQGEPITLGRPVLRTLRWARLNFSELQTDVRQIIAGMAEADAEERERLSREAFDKTDAGLIAWWQRVVADTAKDGGKLPDDPDEWPGDLVMGENVILRVLDHWMNVPSDRGRMGRPLPAGQ